jgi:hypothetical chaperone protein
VRINDRTAIGIDFGTTNSSIARATGGDAVELVRFPSPQAPPRHFAPAYLNCAGAAAPPSTLTGPTAIEQYLAAKGRLIQSLKSYLTSRSLTTTDFDTGAP